MPAPAPRAARPSPRATVTVAPQVDALEERRLFAAALVHQELHRPPTALGRFDGDRREDLVVASVHEAAADGTGARRACVGVLLGRGDGSFVGSDTVKGEVCDDANDDGGDERIVAFDVAAGDLDGDGDADVALKLFSVTGQPSPVGEATNELRVRVVLFEGTGDGGLAPAGKSFVLPHVLERAGGGRAVVPKHVLERTGLFIADVDGDGFGDVVSTSETDVVVALMAKGGPRQTTSQDGSFWWDGTIKGSARTVGVGDLDGDGRSDLVAALGDGSVRYASFSDGSDGSAPGFRRVNKVEALAIKQATPVHVGDFDGDGRADDLVAATGAEPTLVLGLGDGKFATSRLSTGPIVERLDPIVVGDVDGDGLDDLLALAAKKPPYTGHVTILK